MKGRTESEQERVNALKVARAAIRLKYMLQADIELNRVLPEIDRQIVALQESGKSWMLDSRSMTVLEADDV